MDTIQSINSQRIGIIDCGTNTFNLLVVECTRHDWRVLFSNKIAVKIGEGGFEENRIVPSKMARAVDVLHHYKEVCQLHEVEKVRVVATSAIRDASNQNALKAQVKKYVGWEMEVISGDQEADWIYHGVRLTGVLNQEKSLIMDIGGGSTEWIIANQDEIFWKKSYPLGVSRLFEQIQPEERMSAENIKSFKKILSDTLQDLKNALMEHPCKTLVGASGSFDTLWDIFSISSGELHSHSKNEFHEIPISAFPSIHIWLMGSTLKERLAHPAIPTLRAQYLPLSSLMIQFIIQWSGTERIFQSNFALKEGLMDIVIAQENR